MSLGGGPRCCHIINDLVKLYYEPQRDTEVPIDTLKVLDIKQ
jgi:hypothetical protein